MRSYGMVYNNIASATRLEHHRKPQEIRRIQMSLEKKI